MRNLQYPVALSKATKIPEAIIRAQFTHGGHEVEDQDGNPIGFTLADVTLAMLKLGWAYIEIPTLPHYDEHTRIPNWPNLFETVISRNWFPNIITIYVDNIYKLLVWEAPAALWDVENKISLEGIDPTSAPHFIGVLNETREHRRVLGPRSGI